MHEKGILTKNTWTKNPNPKYKFIHLQKKEFSEQPQKMKTFSHGKEMINNLSFKKTKQNLTNVWIYKNKWKSHRKRRGNAHFPMNKLFRIVLLRSGSEVILECFRSDPRVVRVWFEKVQWWCQCGSGVILGSESGLVWYQGGPRVVQGWSNSGLKVIQGGLAN